MSNKFFIIKRAREPHQAFDRLVTEATSQPESEPASPMQGRTEFLHLFDASVREINQMFDDQTDSLKQQIRESDSLDERRELRARKRTLIEAKRALRSADKSTTEKKAVAIASARLELNQVSPPVVGCLKVKQGWWLFFGEELEDIPADTEEAAPPQD